MRKLITFGLLIVGLFFLLGLVWGGSTTMPDMAVSPLATTRTGTSLVTVKPDPDPMGHSDGDGILMVEIVEVSCTETETVAAMTATTAPVVLAAPEKILKMSSDLLAVKQVLEYRRAEALRKHGAKKGWDENPPKPADEPLYEEWVQVQAQAPMPAPPKL